jgi:hypothetical protein
VAQITEDLHAEPFIRALLGHRPGMTRHHKDTQALSAELVTLLRLTRVEAQIARIRMTQARDEGVRAELRDNAEEADLRAVALQDALRRVGGAPDVVGDALGRAVALTKATAEQLQPFSEGLLGDLALEHQLLDRVFFTRALAVAQDEPAVAGLMDDLEAAHTETVEWIRLRLAELAEGGPVALVPTPTQAAASAVARFATLPSRQSAALLNRAADALLRGGTKAAESAEDTAAARKVAGRTRPDSGRVAAKSLPIDAYDSLSSVDAARRIKRLGRTEELRAVLDHEQAHKNRKGPVNAARTRLAQLAR